MAAEPQGEASTTSSGETPSDNNLVVRPGERLLVKRASLSLEVDDLPVFTRDARRLAKSLDGFVENAWTYERSCTITLRVPAPRLEECLGELEKLGSVENRSYSSTDVTEQVVDLDARRKNLAAVRDRLRSLLERAANVGEMVAVERELARVQGDLDALDARLKHLRATTSLSEVTVTASRERILGPLGYLGYGLYWVVAKLFVLR
jgi:hypothetical protein